MRQLMPFAGLSRVALLSGARRRLAPLGVAALLAFALPLPAFSQAGETHLRVAQPWELVSFAPSATGIHFRRAAITETLTTVDLEGNLVPGLAASWVISDDGLEYRFRLREGVLFHDGSAATPEAVAASYRLLTPASTYLSTVPIAEIGAEGDEVIFRLESPFNAFLSQLADPTAAVLAPASFDAAGEVVALIATGPFRITSADLPRSLELARHEGYWGEPARAASATIEAVSGNEARMNIALAGDADLVIELPAPAIGQIEAQGSMEVVRNVLPRTIYLMPNAAKPQFGLIERQALSLAIDRLGLASAIMRNPALAATGYFPPSLPQWQFETTPRLTQDLAAANALLEAEGWVLGEDGIRSRGDERFAGELRTFPGRPVLPVLAAALAEQFRAIGFEMSVRITDWTEIPEGQRDGSLDLGMSMRAMVNFVPEPIGNLIVDFGQDAVPPGATGGTNWRSDELRAAIASYTSTSDEAVRAEARQVIARVLGEELPVIPLVWADEIVAVGADIEGYAGDPVIQAWSLDRMERRAR